MSSEAPISDADKVRIASDFLTHAPPGEFTEVFNSVRWLFNNDDLLKAGCAPAFAQHNKEQFVPVRLEGSEKPTLITEFNDLHNGRFLDPRSRRTFAYDHVRREASDEKPPVGAGEGDEKTEAWRRALQQAADAYIEAHYHKAGIAAVFSTGAGSYTLCIESHQFQPQNFWNGRWRSQWTIPIGDLGKSASGTIELNGTVKVQVHYYEDGNVQLMSSKSITHKVNITTGDLDKSAKDVMRVIAEQEGDYQAAVADNYQTMSDTTFKALRRQLPVTRTKLDWAKVQSYRIAQDMKPQ